MDRIGVSTYENGLQILNDARHYPRSSDPLSALALVQHDGMDTHLADMAFWNSDGLSAVYSKATERALLVERDAGSGELAHSAMCQLSERIDGPCGVLTVKGARFPLDMNRHRKLAVVPQISEAGWRILLRVYDETRADIVGVLRRMRRGAVVFDVHTMWPWNLENLPYPIDWYRLLDATVSHIHPDNWTSPRSTFVCKGDASKFPHVADQGLFEAVEREFRGIGLDFGTDEPFDPGRLGSTYTGALYARRRIKALIVDVPKHEVHVESREDYARAPWDAHLSGEKIDRIGGALARAASATLLTAPIIPKNSPHR